MKQISIFLFLVFNCVCAFTQSDFSNPSDTRKFKNEIGFNFFNITGRNFPYTNALHSSYNQNFLMGIIYKRLFDKCSLRVGVDYYFSKYHIEGRAGHYFYEYTGKNNYGE